MNRVAVVGRGTRSADASPARSRRPDSVIHAVAVLYSGVSYPSFLPSEFPALVEHHLELPERGGIALHHRVMDLEEFPRWNMKVVGEWG
jgi:hypothetical protein